MPTPVPPVDNKDKQPFANMHLTYSYLTPLGCAQVAVYRGALQGASTGKSGTGHGCRNGSWTYGYTYGANSIWQMHNAESKTHPPITGITTASTDWYLELDLAGAYYAAVIRRFFLSLPDYFTREPDSSFILSDTHEPKDGTLAKDRLISGLRGKTWALVQLPYGSSVTVDLGRALGAGAQGYRAWWMDPKTGGPTCLDSGAVRGSVDEPQREFKSPTEGSIQTDWIFCSRLFP